MLLPSTGELISVGGVNTSLLSLFRGRTLMEGDHQAGFSVFWADDGLDTGPILLQKSCHVDLNDTVDSLYNRFLFPEGIRAMVGLDGALDPFTSVVCYVISGPGMTLLCL